MTSSYSVYFTFEARQDLLTICSYIENRLNNAPAASELADSVTSSAASLSSFPKRYRVRRKDRRGQELRYMPVNNFVLVYCVDDSAQTVCIVRISYGKRDIDSLI